VTMGLNCWSGSKVYLEVPYLFDGSTNLLSKPGRKLRRKRWVIYENVSSSLLLVVDSLKSDVGLCSRDGRVVKDFLQNVRAPLRHDIRSVVRAPRFRGPGLTKLGMLTE